MAPHSSTLAWKIPWVEKPGMLSAKSRTWMSNFTFTFHFHALEKEMATHSSVLAGGAWWAAIYGVSQSWTRLKRLRSSRHYVPNATKYFNVCFLRTRMFPYINSVKSQDEQIQHCCCSVAKSCPTLCDPMNWSRPGFPCPLLSFRVCSSLYPFERANS